MKRSEFSEWCRAGVRLLDGATGTNLMRAGMPRGVCTEQWVLEHPQTILKLQRDYAAAGSEVLYAPTFCANRYALKDYGLEERLHTMNVSLVQLTRRAAGAGVLVAGDMTTLGRPVEEDGVHSYQALLRVYREQAEALVDGGVDLFAVETMMGVTESMAAVEAIRSVCDLPILCTLSVPSDGQAYVDGNAAEAAASLEEHGADAVAADDDGLRMAQQQLINRSGMIRLHVLNDEEIQRASGQNVLEIFKKHLAHRRIDGVKQDGLLIQQQIGIVAHAIGHGINALEQGEAAVVSAHPPEVLGNLANTVHKKSPSVLGEQLPCLF